MKRPASITPAIWAFSDRVPHAGGDGGLEHGSLVEKQEEGVVADCTLSLLALTGTTEAPRYHYW
jgi:hypothetical protein